MTLKELIKEAAEKYGIKNADLGKDGVDKIFGNWFEEDEYEF